MDCTEKILGLATWGAKKGVGTHLTLELGEEWLTSRNYVRGKWSIWVAGAPWRIISEGSLIEGSDSEHICSEKIGILNNRELEKLKIGHPAYDAVFEFSGNVRLEVFMTSSDGTGELIVMSKNDAYSLNGNGKIEHESS
ncbi:hypothetical protein [Thalassovita aquimarina]|uniref:hypothetical protein n=1 Tax=Thalassovita aquimarina TaxID=2785917 RepID=UPI003563F1B3